MDFLKGRKGRKKEKEGDRNDSISSPSLDSMGSPTEDVPGGDHIPPRMKQGGWDETPSGSAKAKTSTNIIEQERFLAINKGAGSPIRDDIPTIPDLDDIQDDQIKELAPRHSMSVQMAATYKVLDKDSKIGSYAALDGLDLSMLSKCLEVGDLNEPDEEWNWDTLFAQITSEITVRTGAVSPGDAAGNSTAVGSYIH